MSPPGRSFKEAFTACATSIASGVLSPSPQKRRRTTRGGVAPVPSSSGADDASVHRYPATPVPEGRGGRFGSAACSDPGEETYTARKTKKHGRDEIRARSFVGDPPVGA